MSLINLRYFAKYMKHRIYISFLKFNSGYIDISKIDDSEILGAVYMGVGTG